jgi:hypothetical protein
MRRIRFATLALVISAALAAPAAALADSSGAAGEKEYFDTGWFRSTLFSDACGFEVMRRNHGHLRLWEEPRGNRIVFRAVFAETISLQGPSGKTHHLRDRGQDRETLLPDGSIMLAVVGRSVYWESTGRLVLIDDEEVSKAGTIPYDTDRICARIAP